MEHNRNLSSLIPETKEAFKRDGFFLMKGFLATHEVSNYLSIIDDIMDLPKGSYKLPSTHKQTQTIADGVTKNSKLWPLIFNSKLLVTVRHLVGNDIRYTQHSDIHINLPGGRWHRDNAYREFGSGSDWQENAETYGVVRVAIYLSDYSNSGSSLLVLPGSHRQESSINRREYVFWNKLRSFARRRNVNGACPHIFLSRPYVRLKTHPGDCLIFDQRVMHAGGNLHGPLSKYAIYMSYGANNSHAANHRTFFLRRPTYSKTIPTALKNRLIDEQLLLPQHDL